MRSFLNLVRRFQRDEGGAFIAIFAVIGIVLIATAGAVVDYTSVEQARTRAQVALDATSLALQPSIYTLTTAQLKTKAQAVLSERIVDPRITATVQTLTKDTTKGEIYMTATVNVPLSFVALIGISNMSANIESKATRGSMNLEVALALDITYSMQGTKIEDLKSATNDLIDLVVKDVQTPTYTKMAMVPYSNAVNLGSMAASARGPVTTYTNITAAAWINAGQTYSRTISAISKANPAVVTTSAAHGFATGDTVQISNVAVTSPTTGTLRTIVNLQTFTITVLTTTTFRLNGTNTSGSTGTYTANSGRVVSGPTTRAIQAVSKQNPGQITTTYPHGLATGDAIYLTSAAGGGFTALNNREFQVTVINSTVFSINQNGANVSTSGYSGTYTANSGVFRKCLTNECEVVVTSASHGLAENDNTYVTSVAGMTQVNNTLFAATAVTPDTFVLENTDGWNVSAYTSGGRSYCTKPGCYYQYFERSDGVWDMWTISDCVTERIGANQYDDLAPTTTWVGRNYPSTSWLGLCPGLEMVPLTADKPTLHTLANSLAVEGSTAGQIGLAWAWYAVSPNFASVFPTATQDPADYATPNLVKVVILMTDGAFNTAYCDGILSDDFTIANSDERAECEANNGDPFDQATALCDAIKAKNIVLYTVAFDLGSDQDAIDLMADCATDADHAFAADDGADLSAAFQEIGNNIAALRIAS